MTRPHDYTRLLAALAIVSCGGDAMMLEPDISDVPWDRLTGRIAVGFESIKRSDTTLTGLGLWVIDANARRVDEVRVWPGRPTMWGLAWSPDGSRLAYSIEDPETVIDLFSIAPDGSDERALFSSLGGRALFPTWADDGRLAFLFDGVIGNRLHALDVFVGEEFFFDCDLPDDGEVGRCLKTRPAWAPDGQLIVSLRDSTTTGALYRIGPTGAAAPLVQAAPQAVGFEFFEDPVYSPDGTKVAFVRASSTRELWLMNPDGTERVRLTSDHSDRSPAWSPDGAQLAFSRALVAGTSPAGSRSGIFVINRDGSGLTLVTLDFGRNVSWTR